MTAFDPPIRRQAEPPGPQAPIEAPQPAWAGEPAGLLPEGRSDEVVGELLALAGALTTCTGGALVLLVGGIWVLPGSLLATMGGLLPLGAGLWLLRPRAPVARLDGVVVRLARRQHGRFTAADLVAATGMAFTEVGRCLDRLSAAGHLCVHCDEESGLLVYSLPEPGSPGS